MPNKTVTIVNSVYDHGEDHHPPGYLAMCGDVLNVKKNCDCGVLEVSHTEETESFLIYPNEYKLNEECDV